MGTELSSLLNVPYELASDNYMFEAFYGDSTAMT